MKKIILAVAALAVASMAVGSSAMAFGSSASAGVERYQLQKATFTVTQPAGAEGQWDNVWTHDFTVTVNPCDGTFTGTGKQTGADQNGPYTADETISGTFAKDSVSLTSMRSDGVEYTLKNAPFGGAVTIATLNVVVPWKIEMKVTKPVFTNMTNFKNHGEYVSSVGGGDDAAHSCIGTPKKGPADNVVGSMLYNNPGYGLANFTFAGQDGGAPASDKGTAFYADKSGHYVAKATSVDVGPTSATMSLLVTSSTHPDVPVGTTFTVNLYDNGGRGTNDYFTTGNDTKHFVKIGNIDVNYR